MILTLAAPFTLFSQSEQEKEWLNQVRVADEFIQQSKYDSALIVIQQVALGAEEVDSYEFMTRAYIVMGGVYLRTNKLDLAWEFYDKARHFAELWGNKSFVARVDLVKGTTYDQMAFDARDPKKPTYDTAAFDLYLDSALIMYKDVRKYYLENDPENYLMLAIVANNIARNYFIKEDYLSSAKEGKVANRLYMRAEYETFAIINLHSIGNSYLNHYRKISKKREDLDSAKFYLLKSYKLGLANEMTEITRSASKDLAMVNQYLNNTDSALYYWGKADSLLMDLYSNDYDNRVLELRAEYETATAELEAEKATIRSLRSERNRNITIIVSSSIILLFSIWLYVIDQKRKSIKAIAAKNDELNKQRIDELLKQQEIASLQGVLEGQEQERKRVAIDLHDRLGGILSMVKLHFSAVEEKLPEDNPEKKKFLTASELLDLAAGEVRNISHNLLSGVLAKFGLLPALKDLTDRINESGGIKLNLLFHNVENALNGEQELQVYRIIQELISNILKHSQAKEATIQLIRNDEEKMVNLVVEDDGKGFDPSKPSLSGGIGLSNLKARVSKLNGQFHIDSGKGAGTSISINIPIADD